MAQVRLGVKEGGFGRTLYQRQRPDRARILQLAGIVSKRGYSYRRTKYQ
jgi:hypothetical protein